MAYRVYKDGKLKSFKTFATYEEARQFARKLLRKIAFAFTPDGTQPLLGEHGYEVRKIN